MRLEASIVVAAPPDAVFDEACDIEARTRDVDELRRVEVSDRTADGFVARMEEHYGGRDLVITSRFRFERPRWVTYEHVDGPYGVNRGRFTIEADDGGTRLHQVHETEQDVSEGTALRAQWLAMIDAQLAAIAAGARRRASAGAVDACLARIARFEERVHAFAWLDAERLRGLAGVPVGVKDIVDTAGIPTERGSPLFAGRVPERSAGIVLALERTGAVVAGKTVTAELAFAEPGPTRNPWDLSRTPGGSSMGSAAGVAAGFFPLAVGTQTHSSIVMPAALCGVVGFRPTRGTLSTEGVMAFSPTLDEPGGFARTVAGVAELAAGMGAGDLRPPVPPAQPLRLAAIRTSDWGAAEPAMRRRFEADVDALRAAGAVVERPALPPRLDEARAVLGTIMAVEGAAALGADVARRPELVSERLRAFLERGAVTSPGVYAAALAERRRLVAAFTAWVEPYDAVLTPPAPGEAGDPAGTGDPRFCSRWSLVGAPALNLPTGLGPGGLPLGLQLVGAPHADQRLLDVAAWAERVLPRLPDPPLAA